MLALGWYRFFGWVFFVFTAPSAILHGIYKIPSFNQRIALRLLLSMSIADGVQTVIHLISSVVTIFDLELPYHANIVLGLLIETFWEAMMFLQLGLGANRLYIVTRRTITREKELNYFDWPVVLGWLSSFIYTALYWIGGRRLHYEIEFLGWPTAYTNGTLQTDLTIYLYNGEMVFMCVGFVLCVMVIAVMAYRRRTKAVSNRLSNASMEFRMLAQVSVIYLMAISNILLWNIFNEAPVEYQALLNLEWILICVLPPYLNILISGIAPSNVTRILPKPSSFQSQAITHLTRIQTTFAKKSQINPTILRVSSTLKVISEMNEMNNNKVEPQIARKKRVAFAAPTSTGTSSIKSAPN
ncbi:hypothetical protein M3Y97_00659300 [Aphelenchoides bicaudatus]|nr:hypothetical protein M3Y97_00659300 [Aphelenchoides bicaudatus]